MVGLRREPIQEDASKPGRDDVLVVSDLEMLRLVSDPFRIQLLELLREAPRTVKELAATLGVPPTRLYYHINLLEEHGLIRVASSRLVSGILEKRYEVTASRLSVDRALLSPGKDAETGLGTHLSFVLDESKAEIARAFRAGLIDASSHNIADGGLVLGRSWLRLSPAQAAELDERIGTIFEEYKAAQAQTDGPDRRNYELLIGFYPTAPREQIVDDLGGAEK
jgi:DNA-binding transcriptional ArsR family regulator